MANLVHSKTEVSLSARNHIYRRLSTTANSAFASNRIIWKPEMFTSAELSKNGSYRKQCHDIQLFQNSSFEHTLSSQVPEQ
jgi:hypothetical protein